MEETVVVTGFHGTMGALEQSPDRVIAVYREGDPQKHQVKLRKLIDLANELKVPVEERSSRFFRDHSKGRNAQGVAVRLKEFPYVDLENILCKVPEQAFILVCDGVKDPQNLGAIIRSAAFFGAHAMVIAKDRSAGVSPLAERISAGGAAALPIARVTNLARALERLRESDFWVFGTVEAGGDSLQNANLSGRAVIVVGAEGEGMRRLTRKKCDVLLTLPATGSVPALNVSVFAGLMMYEAQRQQNRASKGR